MSGRLVTAVLESALPRKLKLAAVTMASFATDDGVNVFPSLERVAWMMDVSVRQAHDSVTALRDLGVLIRITNRRKGHATEYVFDVSKLPVRAPFAPLQDTLPIVARSDPAMTGSGLPVIVDRKSGAVDRKSGAVDRKWASGDPSLDPRSASTHTPRAREALLPLVGVVGRDPDHAAHSFCGRICVPRFLHKQFRKALGGPVSKRSIRLRAFYAETLEARPSARPIGDEPVKFWRAAFAARFGGAVPRLVSRRVDGVIGRGCPHDPICASFAACRDRALAEARAERAANQR